MKLYLQTLKLEFHRTFLYQEIYSSFEFLSIHLKMYKLGFPWWLSGKEFTCQRRSPVQFSRSATSDSLRPHEPQHARPPCPPPTPRVHPNPCPSSRWCHPAISSSVVPFSSCSQSFSASGSFQMSQLFSSGGQSIGVSASTSVLRMNTQDWHWFNPWSGKIPHAAEQLSPCTPTIEPVLWSLGATTSKPTHLYWSSYAQSPCSATREATETRSHHAATREWLCSRRNACAALKTQHSQT